MRIHWGAARQGAAALAAARKWFKEAQFGMMAHFGLYTLAGGEWNGKSGMHPYGEWIMHGEKIPNAEPYAQRRPGSAWPFPGGGDQDAFGTREIVREPR